MSKVKLVELDANQLAEAFSDQNVLKDLENAKLLVSYLSDEEEGGDIFVLYKKDRKLYEANGYRCRGYDFEGQWEPTYTTYKALAIRTLLFKFQQIKEFFKL